MDYMNQYWDRDFCGEISNSTNHNYVTTSGRNLNTRDVQIERFIGINIMMSTIGYTHIKMYWQGSTRIPSIADLMSRDRFFKIRANITVIVDADVSDDDRKADRLWKMRPVMDRVRQGCRKQCRTRQVSIDEQMIPFSGACVARQYVPNKHNPVGRSSRSTMLKREGETTTHRPYWSRAD